MDWEIGLSRQAEKFLSHRHLPDAFALEPVGRAIRKLQGEIVAVDLKRLSGMWEGCYRVRVGKIRVIFSMNPVERTALIEIVDNRGSVYR